MTCHRKNGCSSITTSDRLTSSVFQQLLSAIIQRQNPVPPLLPFNVAGTGFVSLVLDRSEIGDLLPWFTRARARSATSCSEQPPSNAACRACRAVPSSLAHQTFHSIFFGPALFHRDVWEICRAVPSAAVDKGYPYSVGSEDPIHRIRARFERPQKRQGARQRRK